MKRREGAVDVKNRRIFSCLFVLIFLISGAVVTPAWAAKIVIFGDSQRNEPAQRRVAAAVIAEQPDIVFRVGDLVDNGNDPDQWAFFREINAPLMENAEYFPCLGNHEHDSPLYFEQFPFLKGKRWYSVDRSGIHFTVLDSNSSLKPDSDQYQWLKWDLSGKREGDLYKVVIFHHPIFDVGEGHRPDEKGLKNLLLPLFKQNGVDAVFNGHDHNYQRFKYNGVTFVITGGGGTRLDRQARPSPYLEMFKAAYHYCVLNPEEDGLEIRVWGIDGELIDEFLIGGMRAAVPARL